jgi:hypothetical protein
MPIDAVPPLSSQRVLKFALAIGIAAEWLLGPAAHSWPGLGQALLRALMLASAAWIALEGARLLVQWLMSLDDGASGRR